MARTFLILLALLGPLGAEASSCCGQSPASYQVLYQQQKYSISPGMSYTQSMGRVYDNSEEYYVWSKDKQRSVQALTITAAASLAEHHQILVTTAYMTSTYAETTPGSTTRGSSENFSDTLLGYSYEVLPEYTYSAWKPVVFLSAFVNVPTGRSIYDKNELSEGADVTGHNQWGGGVGVTARKVLFPYTMIVQAKVLRLLEKDFEQVRVSGFYDTSFAGFLTYATKWWDFSFTGGMTWNTMSPRELSLGNVRSGSSQVSTVIASVQKPINDEFALSLAYADQTLLGSPRNTLLNKTYTLNLSYNFF